ncbi:hypothetical protein HFO17_02195 [Rhizobium laguerreae]|uniref:hypothetical protein n=1 Tax=Rhizobium laguerreae TaxID=1076926 RepID=UPI001C91AB26|nr:hypothetical protein [Rhizobium laguerreae]MBY3233382.1 hypothetical protein [Rhizobium laguerreae]
MAAIVTGMFSIGSLTAAGLGVVYSDAIKSFGGEAVSLVKEKIFGEHVNAPSDKLSKSEWYLTLMYQDLTGLEGQDLGDATEEALRWKIKLDEGPQLSGSYQELGKDGALEGRTGKLAGFKDNESRVVLSYEGDNGFGYGNLVFQRQTVGADDVFVGVGFIHACRDAATNTCKPGKPHKFCRAILTKNENAAADNNFRRFFNFGCSQFEGGDLSVPMMPVPNEAR